MIRYDLIGFTSIYMRQDIIVYLNLYEVSSLQIQEKSKTHTYEM